MKMNKRNKSNNEEKIDKAIYHPGFLSKCVSNNRTIHYLFIWSNKNEQQQFQILSQQIDKKVKLNEIMEKLIQIEKKINQVGEKVDKRIDALDKRMEEKVDALEKKFEKKMDALEEKIDLIQTNMFKVEENVNYQFEILVRKIIEGKRGLSFSQQFNIRSDEELFYYISSIICEELKKDFLVWDYKTFVSALEKMFGKRLEGLLMTIFSEIGEPSKEIEINVGGAMSISYHKGKKPEILVEVGEVKQVMSQLSYDKGCHYVWRTLAVIEQVLFALDYALNEKWSKIYDFDYKGILYYGKKHQSFNLAKNEVYHQKSLKLKIDFFSINTY